MQPVAELTGLSIDTLRSYQRSGLLEPIGRAHNVHRRYTRHDLAWIDLLILLRNTGMSRAHMARFAELHRQGDVTLAERRHLLDEHLRFLVERMRELEQHMPSYCQKSPACKNARSSEHMRARPKE